MRTARDRAGGPRPGTFRAACALCAVVLGAGVVAATGLLPDARTAQIVDDAAQLAAGTFATACCLLTWRGAVRAGLARSAWMWRLLLGLGTTGWTGGQGFWSWYQIVERRPLPSPSWADVGYFCLPLFALPALLVLPAGPAPRAVTAPVATAAEPPAGRAEGRGRVLLGLDAVVIVGSLVLLSWSTSLGAVVRAGAPTTTAFLIAIGYPVTDAALVVIVLLIAVFRRPQRPLSLILLGAGLTGLAVSDSFFLYLVSSGATAMPPGYDVGFVAGPLLVGLGALAPRPTARPGGPSEDRRAVTWYTLLPYVPLLLTGVLVVVQEAAGLTIGPSETYGLILLVAVVVGRQFLTILENLDLLWRVREGQHRLHHQAFHDWLTGLPNRALFRDRLDQAVERLGRDGHRLALLFCDLDDFKRVNDSFGHAAGDELLQVTAERLAARRQPGDTVARLGGDEFAVILVDHEAPAAAARDLLTALARPVTLTGRPHVPRASAGLVVVEAGDEPVTSALLLHRADAAMYVAKRSGKGTVVGYEPPMEGGHLAVRAMQALTEVLAGPPADGESDAVGLAYQPIVPLGGTTPVAVEALLRWDHPTSGPVPPELLVHLAESADLVDALEDQVLDRACRDVALLRAGALPDLAVHVNVTAGQVTSPALVDRVRATLERRGLPGAALVLEVTETGRISDLTAASRVLDALRALGVRLALDDFGAGHSNLDYLLQLPIDILKLDRALIVGGRATPRADAISAGAIQIARALDIPVIAEGVEETGQADRLRALGCQYGQGYLYSPPVPLAALLLPGQPGGQGSVKPVIPIWNPENRGRPPLIETQSP